MQKAAPTIAKSGNEFFAAPSRDICQDTHARRYLYSEEIQLRNSRNGRAETPTHRPSKEKELVHTHAIIWKCNVQTPQKTVVGPRCIWSMNHYASVSVYIGKNEKGEKTPNISPLIGTNGWLNRTSSQTTSFYS